MNSVSNQSVTFSKRCCVRVAWFVALCATMHYRIEAELSVPAAAADTLFAAHAKAFYRVEDGRAWFLETTEGGKASFWMRAEQMEMVLDACERTKKPEQLQMFASLFRGFVADHGANWSHNPFNDDIMWMAIACARAHLLTRDRDYLKVAND